MNDHATQLRAFLEARYEALSAGRRPVPWKTWVASAAVLAGCGSRTDPLVVHAATDGGADALPGVEGKTESECMNELDDDNDGWVDCEEPECASWGACGARYGIPYDGG